MRKSATELIQPTEEKRRREWWLARRARQAWGALRLASDPCYTEQMKQGTMAEDKRLFANMPSVKPPEPEADGEKEVDLGACASVPRGKWVTAPKSAVQEAVGSVPVRRHGHPLGVRADAVRGRVRGREERWKLIVKGRNLHGIYMLIVQHRLKWLAAADRDFAEDGEAHRHVDRGGYRDEVTAIRSGWRLRDTHGRR